MDAQTQFNSHYDTFCELVSEPTNLSGAGNFTMTELNRIFFKKHGILPTLAQVSDFQDMYLQELNHNTQKLQFA